MNSIMGDACQVGGKNGEIQPRGRVCKLLEIAVDVVQDGEVQTDVASAASQLFAFSAGGLDIGVGSLPGSGSSAMLSMNTTANKLATSNGNMNLKPSDASGVVHAHRVPMALAIIKTDPMVARMANVIF
jgi:hypothetical protein